MGFVGSFLGQQPPQCMHVVVTQQTAVLHVLWTQVFYPGFIVRKSKSIDRFCTRDLQQYVAPKEHACSGVGQRLTLPLLVLSRTQIMDGSDVLQQISNLTSTQPSNEREVSNFALSRVLDNVGFGLSVFGVEPGFRWESVQPLASSGQYLLMHFVQRLGLGSTPPLMVLVRQSIN